MSSDDHVVLVEGLGKTYPLYASPRDRLKQFVLSPLRRALGLRAKQYFDEYHALTGASFSVGRGETVGIIGRNGSGKSTLLQILCGTLTPTAGTLRVRGRIAALLELGAGFNPEFTGRENVYLNAAILGLRAEEITQRMDQIVRFADIGEFIDQPIKTYSSGMVVRLAFATAIHVDPDILVVDEALAVGDVAFQQKCLDQIRRLQARGVSILLVTHSTNALIEYCDRAILLQRGRLLMDGACRDVVKAYADLLVEEEGGVPGAVQRDAPERAPPGTGTPTDALSSSDADEAALAIESFCLLDGDGRPCSALVSGGTLRIRASVRANRVVAEPCFGIQLSSVDGISLWSATTQTMGCSMPAMEAGVFTCEWLLQVPFGGSRYVVALGVGEMVNGEYRRTHRVGYAGHFDVLAEPHGGSGWLAPSPVFVPPVRLAVVVSNE